MIEAKQKPCILQILPALNTGGVERGVMDLAIYAKSKGIEIIVASGGGRMVSQLEAAGIKHITLPLGTKNPARIICNSKKLEQICRDNNVKIIHARSRAPAWSAYMAAKKLGLPFVTTFHGLYRNNFPFKRCYNAVMAKGDKVIAVSEFVRQHIFENYKTPAEKLQVIHRGVNLSEFDPQNVTTAKVAEFRKAHAIPEGEKVVLLPGRIRRWKGHDVAVKAIAQAGGSFILAFAGDASKSSNYVTEVKQLIESLGVQSRIRFLGDISDMPLAYAASDVVLSTSVAPETFGRVSAEAGAMGRPVISSDHGGSCEIVDNGVTGYLVPAGNYKALAEKINIVLTEISDAKARDEFAKRTREHVSGNFSLQKMCDDTLNVYKQFYELG